MVDVSSKGMALLYHADKNCPKPDQFITTNFGVPHFDPDDSFDTVFFNRIGRVCRVDNLSSKVNRIAIQFEEPLFFKPGEQNIGDSDAKQRLQAKAQLIVSEKEKADLKTQTNTKVDNQIKPDVEESAPLYSETLARAEERIRSYAEAKAQAEVKLKAEIEARHKSEAKAKTEAKLRAKAEKKARAEAEKRAKIEAELLKKTGLYAEQLAKLKAEAAREIAGIKNHADDTIVKIKAERKLKSQEKKSIPKKNTRDKAKPSGEGVLTDKLDKFITDRNRIF